MKILFAEDDPDQQAYYRLLLTGWGHEVVETSDGRAALEALERNPDVQVALLDSEMPQQGGVDVCREVRRRFPARQIYLIIVTARTSPASAVRGLEAGADDYLRKPVDPGELHARIKNGARTVQLAVSLTTKIRELETALSEIRQLEGLLPICGYCRRVRDDKNYWEQVEVYITRRTSARFSHGICPDCYQKIVEPELRKLEGEKP